MDITRWGTPENNILFLLFSFWWETNPHWARVVGYGPFSLCVIHKEGLCPSSGDLNRLMMMMMIIFLFKQSFIKMLYIDLSLVWAFYAEG
jgi:hypothetical protein